MKNYSTRQTAGQNKKPAILIILMVIYHSSKSANNPQQSLPLVAGTAKTLRLFGRPCAGRYVPRVDTLKIILALALVPVSYQVVAQEMQMFDVYSTAEKLETSREFVMEVEHKSAVE